MLIQLFIYKSNNVIVFKNRTLLIPMSYLFQKRLGPVLQCGYYWSCCTDENDFMCLLATQFKVN